MFDLIAAERRRIADRLEELTPEQWAHPSRCEGWSVQQVAGHLNAPFSISIPRFALKMLRARGNFHRVNHEYGIELGRRSPSELIAGLRDNAEHRFTPPGVGAEGPLSDCILHAGDMFVPLGIEHAVDPEVVVRVMDVAVAPRAKRITGGEVAERYALRATDVDWEYANPGTPVMTGPVLTILEAVYGRRPVGDLTQA